MKSNLSFQLNAATANRAWIPNLITCLRIFGAIILLFLSPLGTSFYIVYSVCGISDVVDGFLARRLGTSGPFGAKLDSVSDLLFYTVFLVRLLPRLRKALPCWIWFAVAAVVFIRLCSYLTAAFRLKEFSARHTILNKISGVLVFGIGIAILSNWFIYYCAFVCFVTFIASTEELVLQLSAPSKRP